MKYKVTYRDGYSDILDDTAIWDMANIDKRDTGLSVNIWVDSAGSSRHSAHDEPRLKIQKEPNNDNSERNFIPVSISKTPKLLAGAPNISTKKLNAVFNFISINYEILMKHWRNEITDRDLLMNLKY